MTIKRKILFLEMPGTTRWPFLEPIVAFFENQAEVEYLKTSNPHLITRAVRWADVVWIEWANQLAVQITRTIPEIKQKKVICRLHGYEVFTDYPNQIDWEVVDTLVFVAKHKQELFNRRFAVHSPPQVVIRNGIETKDFSIVKDKHNTKKMVLLGNLNFRKGVPLLLQFFYELIRKDPTYRLYVRGEFEDPRLELAVQQMIKELNLEEYIIFEKWISDLDHWFKDKSHILSFSLEESFHYAIGDGMAAGLKPIIHAWRESRDIWPEEFIFKDLDGFLALMLDDRFEPLRYRRLIASCGLERETQLRAIQALVHRLCDPPSLGEKKDDVVLSLTQEPKKPSKYSGTPMNGRAKCITRCFETWADFGPYPTEEVQGKLRERAAQMTLSTIKCERIHERHNLWETDMVLEDEADGMVLHHLIYDFAQKELCAPFHIPSPIKKALGNHARKCIEKPGLKLGESLRCTVYDKNLLKKIAENYEEFLWERLYPGTVFASLERFLRHMGRYRFAREFLKSTDRVVEAACGIGYGAKYLSRFCAGVIGMDLSLESLSAARRYYGDRRIGWLNVDACRQCVPDNSVDAFVSLETFEHVTSQKRLLAEVRRILKPSKVAIFSTPNGGSADRMTINNPFHKHEFTHDEIISIFSDYFETIEIYGFRSSGQTVCVTADNAPTVDNFTIVVRSSPSASQ